MERTLEPAMTVPIFEQNCENVRHIRNERIWFGNIYVAVVATALTLLPSRQPGEHDAPPELLPLAFLCVFSAVALLSSLRLVAELNTALTKLQALATQEGFAALLSLGVSENSIQAGLKLRWVFPVFYALATLGFLGVLAYRIWSRFAVSAAH